ncbi:hypothetical protein [Streptomyces sp. NPDC095817]|uniref:hypothetical protein n=1 Tax=Streptomyces sp. NPDC095817 TaxID=3155082 RepID=UPI00331D85B9
MEAGSSQGTAVHGNGGLGPPGHVPVDGFAGIVIPHNASDIAPAWREQLAERAQLVA